MDGLLSQQVQTLIRWLKEGPAGAIPFSRGGEARGSLQAVTWEDAGNGELITELLGWHRCLHSSFGMPLPMTARS